MDYMNCPALIPLKRRWQPKPSAWTPNMLLGKVIAKGLEWHYKGIDTGEVLYALRGELVEGFVEQATWTLDGLFKLASGGLKAGIESAFPLGGTILMVEEDCGGWRPDLVYRSCDSEVVVVDHKVTLSLRPEYVQQRLAEYETSWQFAHYAWGVGRHYGEPVSKVGVHLIVLTPRAKAYTHFVEFTADRLHEWEVDANYTWAEMERSEQLGHYRRNWNYCQRYGSEHRCQYYQGCHELSGDESRFDLFYDRIERGDNSEV
jgi:hypothetical protein